jgi:hypothetical protein
MRGLPEGSKPETGPRAAIRPRHLLVFQRRKDAELPDGLEEAHAATTRAGGRCRWLFFSKIPDNCCETFDRTKIMQQAGPAWVWPWQAQQPRQDPAPRFSLLVKRRQETLYLRLSATTAQLCDGGEVRLPTMPHGWPDSACRAPPGDSSIMMSKPIGPPGHARQMVVPRAGHRARPLLAHTPCLHPGLRAGRAAAATAPVAWACHGVPPPEQAPVLVTQVCPSRTVGCDVVSPCAHSACGITPPPPPPTPSAPRAGWPPTLLPCSQGIV